MAIPSFTICVLGYADYVTQLDRCLASIFDRLPHPEVAEVRIGLNAPSPALSSLATDHIVRCGHPGQPTGCVVTSRDNRGKYPMMRRLFYDRAVETPFVMWFDDDS